MVVDISSNNHKLLQKYAVYWLKMRIKCDIAVPESMIGESGRIVDALGLRFKDKKIYVIEVKTDRNDYLREFRDGGKFIQWNSKPEIYREQWGHMNYLMVPKGLLKDSDKIPEGWGVIELDLNSKFNKYPYVTKRCKYNKDCQIDFDFLFKCLANRLAWKYYNSFCKDIRG